MTSNANFVIVVSILEGKNFPVNHDKYLVVDAKFDGEIMSTDPVAHTLRPHFGTELGWEMDKKGLQKHRMQRSAIKLTWYACDLELTKKDTVGYVILPVCVAQEKKEFPKWYPILNSKYQREKPEVLMLLYLDHSTDEPTPERTYEYHRNIDYRQASTKNSKSPQKSAGKTILKPELLSQAGCYRIGPPELCTERFTFSVLLGFAANLDKLAPPAMLKSAKGFYFYYSLFDNDVTTETFSSLSNPDFHSERALVHIMSSPKILAAYFEQNPYLEIVFCCGDICVGTAHLKIVDFMCISNPDVNDDPLCIEGNVRIVPNEKTSHLGSGNHFPFVGVTAVLQSDKDEGSVHKSRNITPSSDLSIDEDRPRARKSLNFNSKQSSENEEMQTDNGSHKGLACTQAKSIAQNGSSPDSCHHSSDDTPPEVRRPSQVISPPNAMPVQSDNVAHRFTFSLDLANFKATRLLHPIHLFIRYSYPFFGTTSSMITHPDVEVLPKREVSIPHGYCEFNFAASKSVLKSMFWETPLILEALNRKKKSDMEQPVGTARLNLFQVLDAPSVSHLVDKKSGTRQVLTCNVVVTSLEGYEVGEIYAVLTLIDLGPTTVLYDNHANMTNSTAFNEFQARGFLPNSNVQVPRQSGLTQDELMQTAFELQLWQERQKEIFRSQLKDKETQHLNLLSSEWKQRDLERESLLQKKLKDCEQLEATLKLKSREFELKEKQIRAQEAELKIKQLKINQQLEQVQKETKSKIDVIRRDYNGLLAIEKQNVRDLEQKNSSLTQQMREMKKSLQDQNTIISTLKSQSTKDPDVQLRTEVNILNMEKAELQQKFESALVSKQSYKMKWAHVLKQLTVLQQKLHAQECLEKEKRHVTPLPQRALSVDEKNQLNDGSNVEDKDRSRSVTSPSDIQLHLRQMSLPVQPASRIPLLKDLKAPKPENTNAVGENINIQKVNPEKPDATDNTNAHAEGQSSTDTSPEDAPMNENVQVKEKVSPDLNGNTADRNGTTGVQRLIAEKRHLLLGGYTEKQKIIQDLNSHIEKAKLPAK